MALARLTTLLVLSAGFIMSTGSARAAATDWVGDSRAAVRLITAADNITADPTLEAGLEFRFAKGWHGYWRTPGDAGIPPTVDWSASENISSGARCEGLGIVIHLSLPRALQMRRQT